MTNLNIKLHHGLVNSTPKQRAAAQTLGLNKIGRTSVLEDPPSVRGMIAKVHHLVEVVEG